MTSRIFYLGTLLCAGYVLFETDKEICVALVGVNVGTVRIPKMTLDSAIKTA